VGVAILLKKTGFVFLFVAMLCATDAVESQEQARVAVLTTPHFAFFSDYQTNLNDALVQAGIERKLERAELFESGTEETCFAELPPSAQTGWNLAVDYYQQFISPAGFNERAQYLLRMNLAGFYELVSGAIEQRLQALYQKNWGGLPIVVDIVETVSWSGANSIIIEPDSGHLLISNSYDGHSALEIVFHEASHLLMGRNDPVWQALDKAASDLEISVPDGLWHAVLFYTTGEVVRRVLHDAGEEPYEPMIYGIYPRSPWGRFEESIENNWPAYLNGDSDLPTAAAGLLQFIENSPE
jgi:hypothetical protein